jgi:hypothetical protein
MGEALIRVFNGFVWEVEHGLVANKLASARLAADCAG